MNKISMKEIQKIFDKSIAETFNSKYQNYDSVDRTQMYELLLIEGIRDFYFTVSLNFITKYLNETMKK